MKTLKKLNNPYLPAIIGTVALLILGQCLSKGFLSMNNISSILMTTVNSYTCVNWPGSGNHIR